VVEAVADVFSPIRSLMEAYLVIAAVLFGSCRRLHPVLAAVRCILDCERTSHFLVLGCPHGSTHNAMGRKSMTRSLAADNGRKVAKC